MWLQSPTPQPPPTRVAGTGGYDRFLLTFSKLELPERVSCFETLVHFQGKMGLLIRQCDQFCEAHDMFGLFCQMRDVCRQVLEMPHARLWQIDRERNSALCLYNNTVRGSIKAPVLALDLPSAALLEIKPVRYCSQAEDAQNGRLLPFLGCFPGEVARSRKVVICNDATSDSRFQSWQYREMQDETNEPLVPFLSPSNANTVPPLPSPPLLPRQGTIIGVALLDAEERCKHVFECYRPEPAATALGGPVPPCLDGADAFLLQALGDYAGAAAVAIRQRWEQIRVAQLPAILLASDSFAGFISRLREFLKEWFRVLDGTRAPCTVTPAQYAVPAPSAMPAPSAVLALALTRACEWRGSAVEIFMYDDANASRVLWVYEDRAVAANMDKKTRTRSVMDRVVSLKVRSPVI